MGQLEALQGGKQGSTLTNGGNFKGATPAARAGASAINDLHVDDISKPSGHVHRNETLPITDLGTRSETLQGSKFNAQAKYEKPADISGEF